MKNIFISKNIIFFTIGVLTILLLSRMALPRSLPQ